jgi:hypothetical protein
MSHSSEPAGPAEPARAGRCPASRAAHRRARPARQHPAPPRQRPAHGQPCAGRGEAYELTDEDREWIRRTAASLGPLTSRQRDLLGQLLRPHR